MIMKINEINYLEPYYVWHLTSNGKICEAEVIGDKITRHTEPLITRTVLHSLNINCPIEGKIWKKAEETFLTKNDLINALTVE